MFLKGPRNLQNNFVKIKLLGHEIVMVKIGRLSTTLGLLSWWFPALYIRALIPLGAWVKPSITNNQHFEVSRTVTYGCHHIILSRLTLWW